jgi:3-oxoadipate enol-lactonase
MVPGAKWKEIKGGHACMWECPEEFNAAFVSFIEEVQKGIKM